MSSDPNCVFCKIVSGAAESEKFYEDDEIIIFKDMKPAAKYHLLSCPKIHIPNVKSLTLDHKALVEKLTTTGKSVLEEQGGNINDVILGFHVPPFNSISHLHLHIISPTSDMSLFNKYVYKPDTFWFHSVESVVDELSSKL